MSDLIFPMGAVSVIALTIGYLVGRRTRPAPQSVDVTAALAPVEASLQLLAEHIRSTGQAQTSAQAELRTSLTTQLNDHMQAMVRSTDDVRREASQLRSVLGRTGARGRWGEMQLRRLVEAAGLLDRVHFDEQTTHHTDDATLRPDMIVNLSHDRCLVVDAKVPLAAFLSAEQADEVGARQALAQHAADVVRHIEALSARGYQEAIPDNADFVVLFLPSESLLEAALAERPDLLDFAFSRNIVPATPTTLFALLRTVAMGWREERLAEHAEEIQRLGKDLHGRLLTMAGHFARLGSALDSAVSHYNKAIGSLESRVLVSARAFQDLGVSEDALPEVAPVTQPTRAMAAADLLANVPETDIAFLAEHAR